MLLFIEENRKLFISSSKFQTQNKTDCLNFSIIRGITDTSLLFYYLFRRSILLLLGVVSSFSHVHKKRSVYASLLFHAKVFTSC